jgi:hypothetical protein
LKGERVGGRKRGVVRLGTQGVALQPAEVSPCHDLTRVIKYVGYTEWRHSKGRICEMKPIIKERIFLIMLHIHALIRISLFFRI